MATTTTVTIAGMSCGGCASKVSAAIGALEGVSGVAADPGTGRVVVTAESALELTTIGSVVEPIGYRVRA